MTDYDHYIGLDWAQSNMALARLTKTKKDLKVIDVPASIKELKVYFSALAGTKILTFEESTSAQWLFVELSPFVDRIVVCDPRRNKLLSEGPKSDPIDAKKLVQLLRADMLKEVYHSAHKLLYLRKLVSGYDDTIRAGIRLKNQRHALYRASGKRVNEESLSEQSELFVLEGLDASVKAYESEKSRYQKEFCKLVNQSSLLKSLSSIPGIGEIGAVKIASRVVSPGRFETNGNFLSYCGLVLHEKISGGRSYGRRKGAYSRDLKNVFDTAAASCMGASENNSGRRRFDYLTKEKGLTAFNAKKNLARHTAILALAIMRSGKKYEPTKGRHERTNLQ